MRKLLVLILVLCLGCQENKDRETPEPEVKNAVEDSVKASSDEIPEKAFLCFFATENEVQSRELRDSIILNLELTGEVVTGNFNWIPAEKDSRRGLIQATKNGDEVKGSYAYGQEGIEDTIFIEIQLQKTSAQVITLSDSGEEMKFEVERVDCQ